MLNAISWITAMKSVLNLK